MLTVPASARAARTSVRWMRSRRSMGATRVPDRWKRSTANAECRYTAWGITVAPTIAATRNQALVSGTQGMSPASVRIGSGGAHTSPARNATAMRTITTTTARSKTISPRERISGSRMRVTTPTIRPPSHNGVWNNRVRPSAPPMTSARSVAIAMTYACSAYATRQTPWWDTRCSDTRVASDRPVTRPSRADRYWTTTAMTLAATSTQTSAYPYVLPALRLAATLPGSTYAMAATKAGPSRASTRGGRIGPAELIRPPPSRLAAARRFPPTGVSLADLPRIRYERALSSRTSRIPRRPSRDPTRSQRHPPDRLGCPGIYAQENHTRGCQDPSEAARQDPLTALPHRRHGLAQQARWPGDRRDRALPPEERPVGDPRQLRAGTVLARRRRPADRGRRRAVQALRRLAGVHGRQDAVRHRSPARAQGQGRRLQQGAGRGRRCLHHRGHLQAQPEGQGCS